MNFIALDFETANSGRDSVCEIGLTFVNDGKITGSYSRLVKPLDNWFDPFNTSLHGISANTVINEPEFHQIWEEIEPHLEGKNLIAHNAGFDMSVLRHVLDLYQIDYPQFNYSCSYQISKRAWQGLLSYRLDSICRHLGISLNHHRAEADSIACAEVTLQAFQQNEVLAFEDLEKKFMLKIGQHFPGGYKSALTRYPKTSSSHYNISDIEFDKEKTDPEHLCYGRNVVFTGTLSSLVRKDAQRMVLEIGGNCTAGVTRDTHFLVVGEQDYTQYGEGFKSSKMKKAEKLLSEGQEIELITESQFLELFN